MRTDEGRCLIRRQKKPGHFRLTRLLCPLNKIPYWEATSSYARTQARLMRCLTQASLNRYRLHRQFADSSTHFYLT